jgi:DNA topoisomerase-1
MYMNHKLIEKIGKVYSSPQKCCDLIGLNYEMDDAPGITRKKVGEHYKYYTSQGKEIESEHHIDFINKLRIPPAWKDVWIAPQQNYHLQATGIDSKNRKQYIYHPKWNDFRQLIKFYRLIIIGESLPKIRATIESNLKKEGYSKERVLSAIVKIIDTTYIRVGNEQYADDNDSYGVTTLRKKHVEVKGNKVLFDFVGKSGQEHQIEMKDPVIAKILKKLTKLKGYEVFKYEVNGQEVDIKSTDVNNYIKQISSEKITAKDFRTWGGTKLCFEELKMYDDHVSKSELKSALSCVLEQVSSRLGNTKAVCRSHYIHPQILFNFEQKSFIDNVNETEKKIFTKHSKYMEDDELLLLEFLKDFFSKELEEIIK